MAVISPTSGPAPETGTRILKTEQFRQEAFESGIDRGHLTRREDTAWGKDVATATPANNDTVHFTNCSLQASQFNRGKDRWQELEQYLLEKHAKKAKRRMTVITGPLFSANDPVYQNEKWIIPFASFAVLEGLRSGSRRRIPFRHGFSAEARGDQGSTGL
jgi:DNA/RNA endonuclease G (NUC1)